MISIFEMFAGVGTLTRALSDGIASVCPVEVCGANELEGRYLREWARAHGKGSTFHGSAGAFHPVELSASHTPGKRLFAAGVPCTGSSLAGRAKCGLAAAEEHESAGFCFLPTVHYARAHRPDLGVLECVPEYARTASAAAIRAALKASGYHVTEFILDSFAQFETATQRKRWALVACRHARFHWSPVARPFTGTLHGILDDPSERDLAEAFTPEQIAAHRRYIAKKQLEGCGFATRLIDHESKRVPTLCRSYGKTQPSATFVRVGDSYRMIRPREFARIHGMPDDFELPESKTMAYEALGQGVCYRPFYALGAALAEWANSGFQPTVATEPEFFPGFQSEFAFAA